MTSSESRQKSDDLKWCILPQKKAIRYKSNLFCVIIPIQSLTSDSMLVIHLLSATLIIDSHNFKFSN